MPEAVDRNPDLDAAVAALVERLGDSFVAGLRVVAVRDADLRLVLNALADYRARRATGGPAPANTPVWVNGASSGPAPDETIPLPKEDT